MKRRIPLSVCGGAAARKAFLTGAAALLMFGVVRLGGSDTTRAAVSGIERRLVVVSLVR